MFKPAPPSRSRQITRLQEVVVSDPAQTCPFPSPQHTDSVVAEFKPASPSKTYRMRDRGGLRPVYTMPTAGFQPAASTSGVGGGHMWSGMKRAGNPHGELSDGGVHSVSFGELVHGWPDAKRRTGGGGLVIKFKGF
ncbi:unnamed protein product [Linum trigynum]|uniref:Uncharacterized protein n=1 Tax=Linum trigynum TaxID=586398 RepID=A0AAV2GRW6_9ROSI